MHGLSDVKSAVGDPRYKAFLKEEKTSWPALLTA